MDNQSKNSNVSDELLYEFVMDEMEQVSEPIKGLWAKALAHSEGSDSKAKSLYMQYRVQAIKDQLSALQIDLGDLSKGELFESIKNCFTIIPEKIQMIKEQKAVAEEKAIEVAIEEEAKKEREKYSKFGGWLTVLAVFLVLGNIYSFLMVERFFENENLDALKLLYQNGMDDKASLLNTIAYISFVSYGLLLAFTISFFRKAALTKNLAIIYFASNIIAFPIVTYLLIKIDLPTISVMSGVIGGVMQTLFALIWIRYFMVSERVEKTFVNGSNAEITLAISLSVILFTSLSYSKQSSKETIMHGQTTAATVQTTSEFVDTEEAHAAGEALVKQEITDDPLLSKQKQECKDGNYSQCSQIGNQYENSQNGATKSSEFYKKACDGGDDYGCYSLAFNYKNGIGIQQNDEKSLELYKKVCNNGYLSGCYKLAYLYKTGNSVQQNDEKSLELYKKSCIGNSDDSIPEACVDVGDNYRNSDPYQAIKYYKKACDGGNTRYVLCKDYHELQEQGY
jgi:hypothetical protein